MSRFYDWFEENKIEVKVDFTDTEKLEFLDSLVEAENNCELIRAINEILGNECYPEILENRIWRFCDDISKENGSKYGILSPCNLVDLGSLTYDLGAMLFKFIADLDEGDKTRTQYRDALRNQMNMFDSMRTDEYRAKVDLFKRVSEVTGEDNNDLIAHYLEKADDVVFGDRIKNPFDDFRGVNEENDEFIGYFDKKIAEKNE